MSNRCFSKIGFVFTFFLAAAHAESLRYTIKWPSGLTLGEATLTTDLTDRGLAHTLEIEAALPAFPIHDRYHSRTTASRCTITFERDTHHGNKFTNERITVAPDGGITRETVNGGKTELPRAACPNDALALLFSTRADLQQSRLPLAQTVLFGPGYPVRFENAGPETITVSDKSVRATKIVCVLTLPKTGDFRIELFFLEDSARTPALIRAPFALGAFTMELAR